MSSRIVIVTLIALVAPATAGAAPTPTFASHPPMRPLPAPSARPAATGPVYHVDPGKGRDDAGGDGSAKKPWKTIAHAAAGLRPGDTLYLHGGVYFETVTLTRSGTADRPITIRSAPGELAILDGGLREFEDAPAKAWAPFAGGAPGEYVSTAAYPSISPDSGKARGVWVLGHFADSMVPLHGYKFPGDLRSDNPYWTLSGNADPDQNIYVGPGVWLDWKSHRIHVRLAHTALTMLGDDNYRGETDPRKLPLVIAIDRTPLTIRKAKYVRVQDLVLRGAAIATLDIGDADHVELDGLTVYGGAPAVHVRSTDHLVMKRSSVRGGAAPWSSRASMKYRGGSPYLFVADSKAPQSHDWELAYDDFTDGHDGVVLDSVKTVRFHHDHLDNFNDDALYLTLPPRDTVPEDVQVYENLFTRVPTALSFAQADDGSANTVGPGVYVFRNVFDLRGETFGWPPKTSGEDTAGAPRMPSRLCGDHGSPTWEPLFFYQNTVVVAGDVQHGLYGELIVSGTRGSKRRVFDNVFVQLDGNPGLNFQSVGDDLQVDGNLMWSVARGPTQGSGFFDTFRASSSFAASKQVYPPGFGASDVYGDPKFVHLGATLDAPGTLDVRLGDGSAAIDAGVAVPAAWPDTLRARDRGKPDLGALPRGAPMLKVGPAAAPP